MCAGDPEALLKSLLSEPLPRNARGHTALDDFEHFCSYSGLDEQRAGKDAFAWAKYSYLSAWRP
jgi:hypothetical protein